MDKHIYSTPFGAILIKANNTHLLSISFPPFDNFYNEKEDKINDIISLTTAQLDEYFQKKRKTFDIPLLLEGTDFQKNVWRCLTRINYGETATYSDIAEKINNEKAVRAVGNANNKNRIPIIIPCHRIIGKNGSLVGYAGGLSIKKFLLDLEQSN